MGSNNGLIGRAHLEELERKATTIGAPVEIEEFQAVFMATCKQGHEPARFFIPGIRSHVGICPVCRRGYRVNGISALTGQPLKIEWTIMTPNQGVTE